MSTALPDSICEKPRTGEENNVTILVAEDIPILRKTLSVQLPKAFPKSTIAFVSCGEEATKALLNQEYIAVSPDGSENWIEKPKQFDVAFLDHNMPVKFGEENVEGTGVSVALDVRRSRSDGDARCLLVSHSSSQIDESMREAFDRVLLKPATPRDYKEIAKEAYSKIERRNTD